MKKLLIVLVISLVCVWNVWAADYYVSQSGTGDGSTAATPDSIADFNAGVFGELDGDTVYLIGAITTTVTVPDSGTSGNAVDIKGYDSDAVIASSSGNGIYIYGKSYINIYDLNITPNTNGIVVSPGSSNIIIKNCIISNAAASAIMVSANNDSNSHSITIEDNIISNAVGNGIWLNYGDTDVGESGYIYSVNIVNNTIHDSGGRGIRIQSVDVDNDLGYDFLVSGNTIYNNAIGGITVRGVTNTSGDNTITNNTIYGNSESGTLGGIHTTHTANLIVSYNTIYDNHTNNIDGRGIYFDTGTTDFECTGNITYGHKDNSTPNNQSSGIAVTAAVTGTIRFNTTYDNDAGITLGGDFSGITVVGNTVFGNVDRGISIQNSSDSSEVTIKNNIISDNTTHGIYDDDAVNDPTIDYNIYDGNGTDLYQIAAKGANAIDADPLLYSSGKLQSNSPAINEGPWITDVNDDGSLDPWGYGVYRLPNIGADQGAGMPRRATGVLRIGR